MNAEKMKEIGNASETAKSAVAYMADRRRFRNSTNLELLRMNIIKAGKRFVESEFIDFFKGLEKEQVGTLVYSQTGHPERFMWHYSLKNVADMALGKIVELPKPEAPGEKGVAKDPTQDRRHNNPGRPKGSRNKPQETPGQPSQGGSRQGKEILIVLPSGAEFDLVLNQNLTKEDIGHISKVLAKIAS